jgi:hypothetical protein
LLCSADLHPQAEQNNAVLEKIHRRLTNLEKLSQHKPIVFVGEITALGPVFKVFANPQEIKVSTSRSPACCLASSQRQWFMPATSIAQRARSRRRPSRFMLV